PDYKNDTKAINLETPMPLIPTPYAMQSPQLQRDYAQCWQGLKKHFNPDRK
ncbi:homogentisate 1,2-dioxygenase domain-containing protein, partial [Bowmanella yangjiangensis]|nr:homogentisate 1,2-dioxygenase [Bowmanella yangjiangensis]